VTTDPIETSPSPSAAELPLDATEQRIEAWRCLITIASGIFLSAVCLVLLALAISATAPMSGGVLFRLVLPLAVAFLIVWGISRVWPPVIVPGIAAIALFFAWSLIDNQLGLYRSDAPAPSPLAWLLFIAGLVAVFGPLLALAWRVAQTPAEERPLIALPRGYTFGIVPALAAAFGVHPVCAELPTRRQRLIATALFVFCQVVLAFSIFVTVLGAASYFVNLGRALECIPNMRAASCIGSIVGSALWLPLWLLVLIGIAGGLRYLARRFSRTSLESMRSRDPRPPVLFLRSFSDDQVKLRRPRRNALVRLILLGEPRPLLDHILLEEGVRVGPVVAIGAPGGRQPFGAARAYVSDADWQQVVAELARTARMIVIAIDDTRGVNWELNEIHGQRYAAKVLHLMPPRLTEPGEARRVIGLARAASDHVSTQFEALHGFLQTSARRCIGWYLRHDGTTVVLTTKRPSEVSYLLALRRYMRDVHP
jgi:hypothetical protein